MAIPTAAAVVNQVSLKTWDISATDTDSGSVVIVHDFGNKPEIVELTPIIASAFLGDWDVQSDAVNITVTKTDATQGGDAVLPVVRITAMLPHSLLRG